MCGVFVHSVANRFGRVRPGATGLALAISLAGLAQSAFAWPTLVCSASPTLGQSQPAMAANGIGGAYIAFIGAVSGSELPSAYGHHLTHSGSSFPPSACGDTLFLTAGYEGFSAGQPRAAADGSGGVFVAALVSRNQSSLDVVVQRVNAAGSRTWGADGVAVCTASGDQAFTTTSSPAVAEDGSGGCYVVWEDPRFSGTHGTEVFLQHVLFNGTIHSSWPTNGLRLTTKTGDQARPTVVSDGAGGVFAVWEDRGGSSADIMALRVLADTTLAPGWTANGNSVCSASQDQTDPVAAEDGSGGVYITWEDGRGGEIYASHLLGDANLASGSWVADGLAITSVTGAQTHPSITVGPDHNGIITWMDLRQPSNGQDVYAQSIAPDGFIQWTANGVGVATLGTDQAFPRLVSTAASGAVIAWDDKRNVGGGMLDDVFAQAVDSQGQVLWQNNGVAIGFGPGQQLNPVMAPDGDNGAIIAYTQVTPSDPSDVLAARVYASGEVGGVTEVTPGDRQQRRMSFSPNPATRSVSFVVPDPTPDQRILIRDLLGRTIAAIGPTAAQGTQRFHWDLRDHAGKRVPPGAYFVQLLDGYDTPPEMLVVSR